MTKPLALEPSRAEPRTSSGTDAGIWDELLGEDRLPTDVAPPIVKKGDAKTFEEPEA